jgi:phage tail-like protein
MKYTNIKLTRVINADSASVRNWIASMAQGVTRETGEIVATTAEGKEVTKWVLEGVIPVRWTGPSLNVDSNKVATETLELAHHGFIHA